MPNRKSLYLELAVAASLAAPYIFYLVLYPYYVSGPDEAWQIQGIQELLLGHGYLSALHAPFLDLSAHKYFYLHSWPIGFPGVVYVFAKLGMPVEWSLKLFHLASLALGLIFWVMLAHRYLRERATRVLFLALLVPQLIAWAVYPSALASWAMVPVIFYLLTEYAEHRRGVIPLAIATSFFILLRYQNIVFLPAIALFFAWKYWPQKARMLQETLRVLLLPLFSFLMIFVMNRINAGVANPIRKGFGLYWDWTWVPDFLSTFFFGATYRIDEPLRALVDHLGGPVSGQNLLRALALVLCAATLWLVGSPKSYEGKSRDLVALFWACFLSLAGFFISLAIFLETAMFSNGRYFHLLLPALILAVLLRRPRSGPLVWAFSVVAAVMAFCLVFKFAVHRRNLSLDFSAKATAALELIDELRAGDRDSATFVIADHMYPAFTLQRYTSAGMAEEELFSGQVHFSRPTWLFLVTDSNPLKPQYTTLKTIPETAAKLALRELNRGSIRVYGRRFSPGSLLDQSQH